MIELLSGATSSGPGAAVSFPERAGYYTVWFETSSDFSPSTSFGHTDVGVQIATSTAGPWVNAPAGGVAFSSTGSTASFSNFTLGVYVAMRGYLTHAPETGSVSLKLFTDRV